MSIFIKDLINKLAVSKKILAFHFLDECFHNHTYDIDFKIMKFNIFSLI